MQDTERRTRSPVQYPFSFSRRLRQVLLSDSDVGYTLIRIGGKSCAPLTKHFRNDVLTTRMTVRRGSYARNFIHFSVIRGSKLVLIKDPRFSKTSIKSQLMSPMYFGNIVEMLDASPGVAFNASLSPLCKLFYFLHFPTICSFALFRC